MKLIYYLGILAGIGLSFFCLTTIIDKNHAEILTAIETSTQIEDELIEAVNSAIEHIDAGNEIDCSAVVDFIKGVRNAQINRGVDE